jgi:hypothetical protein
MPGFAHAVRECTEFHPGLGLLKQTSFIIHYNVSGKIESPPDVAWILDAPGHTGQVTSLTWSWGSLVPLALDTSK